VCAGAETVDANSVPRRAACLRGTLEEVAELRKPTTQRAVLYPADSSSNGTVGRLWGTP